MTVLRAHEGGLRNEGVVALALFGSVARNDAGGSSDVDVLVRLDDAFRHSGFRYVGRLERVHERLSAILGTDVDIVTEPVREERLRRAIERDLIVAF